MKFANLLILATAVGLGGCYGEEPKQVLNPYELTKQPLVQPSEETSPQPSPSTEDLAQSPVEQTQPIADPDALPTPSPQELANDVPTARPLDPASAYEPGSSLSADDSFDANNIDPRLRSTAPADPSRYEPIRPRMAEAVRPAAGETELEAPGERNNLLSPPRAVEEVPAPSLAVSEEPVENRNDPNVEPEAAPARPNSEDLAIDQPNSLTIPENIPSIADTPPSLNEPEINSVNKPPLTEVPANEPTPAAASPENMRPSDRLLRDLDPAPAPEFSPVEPTEQPAGAAGNVEASPQAAEPNRAGDEASELRTWVDSTGRLRIKARFIKFEGEEVFLRTEDGNVLQIPMERFSRNDRAFLEKINRGDFGI